MHLQGKPVCSFDPEGLIFAAGINSEMVKLYDLRSFDKARGFCIREILLFILQFKVIFNTTKTCSFINRGPLLPSSSSMIGRANGQDSSLAMMGS